MSPSSPAARHGPPAAGHRTPDARRSACRRSPAARPTRPAVAARSSLGAPSQTVTGRGWGCRAPGGPDRLGLALRLLRQQLVQRLRRPAPVLLDRPAVAVRVLEVHERRAVVRGVLLGLADLQPPGGQFGVGRLDVGDAELQPLVGTGGRGGAGRRLPERVAQGDRAPGAGWCQLDDAHAGHDLLVDVDVEADLVPVEVPGPVDVVHGQRDHFEGEVHGNVAPSWRTAWDGRFLLTESEIGARRHRNAAPRPQSAGTGRRPGPRAPPADRLVAVRHVSEARGRPGMTSAPGRRSSIFTRLLRHGFTDPSAAERLLDGPELTALRDDPVLLDALGATADPDLALLGLVRLLEAQPDPTARQELLDTVIAAKPLRD